MEQIYNMTHRLIDSIKQSDYYRDYQECLKASKKKKDVYERFNQFRRQYYALTKDGQENFSEIEKLQQEYHALLVDTDVVEFMDAEDKICAVMKDMYDTIAEGLEFDMDFMEG